MKRFLSLILTLALLLSLVPTGLFSIKASAATSEFAGGAGTESNPYLIATKEHLNNVRNYLDAHYEMIADIEFSDADFAAGGVFYNDGAGWIPIGRDSVNNCENAFKGVFDGNGHKIKYLYINATEGNSVGLFCILQCGTVKNLGMEDCNITADAVVVGGVTGSLTDNATISNCYYAGNISGRHVGGIAGEVEYDSTISNCYNSSNVVGLGTIPQNYVSSVNYTYHAAGITARTWQADAITNCYNIGSISLTASIDNATLYAGGIVAEADGEMTIARCHNTGNISAVNTGSGLVRVGGISAFMRTESQISSSYNAGDISAAGSGSVSAGGILGVFTRGSIDACYNIGDISAITTSSKDSDWIKTLAGGIVAVTTYPVGVTKCYNTGAISAQMKVGELGAFACDSIAGGIVGSAGYDLTVADCYNYKNISAIAEAWSSSCDAYASGIIGYIGYDDYLIASNCYNIGKVTSLLLSHGYSTRKGYANGVLGLDRDAGSGISVTNCIYVDYDVEDCYRNDIGEKRSI